ncbi:MAG: hypothetical protein QW727_00835 [Candidatus Pacearchaeota archaeon]
MKRGQFQLGFGMIFSIILIIAFIIVAFIAFKAFFGVRCSTEQGRFIYELQNEIDRIWKGSGEDRIKEFKILGCDFDYVCFWDPNVPSRGNFRTFEDDFSIFTGDEGNHNLYFYPRKKVEISSTLIKHINMDFRENPVCFRNEENSVKIRLSKNIDEDLVRVS